MTVEEQKHQWEGEDHDGCSFEIIAREREEDGIFFGEPSVPSASSRRPTLSELLPCPFCGASARSAALMFSDEAAEVGCSNEKCEAICMVTAETEAEAIAAWNRRAPLATDRERRLAEAIVYLLGPAEGPDWSDATADSILNEARALLAAPSEPAKAPQAEVFVTQGSSRAWWTYRIDSTGKADGTLAVAGVEFGEESSCRERAAAVARALGLEVR